MTEFATLVSVVAVVLFVAREPSDVAADRAFFEAATIEARSIPREKRSSFRDESEEPTSKCLRQSSLQK